MTAKEKAEQLIIKFLSLKEYNEKYEAMGWAGIESNIAKQCALIVVDEILSLNTGRYPQENWSNNSKYWIEVKEEIKKL